MERSGPVSCTVPLDNGVCWRRHIDHLQDATGLPEIPVPMDLSESAPMLEKDPLLFETPLQLPHHTTTEQVAKPANLEHEAQPVAKDAPSPPPASMSDGNTVPLLVVPVRSSSHISKPPKRYGYDE